MRMQSKLTFNGIQKSCVKFVGYTIQHNEKLMDIPLFLRFGMLELSKLQM